MSLNVLTVSVLHFKFLRLGKVWPEASALNITRPTGIQPQDWDLLPSTNFKENNMAAKPGLYANIHAKQERIKAGSGEKMRKPGAAGAPTAKAFKESAKTAKVKK